MNSSNLRWMDVVFAQAWQMAVVVVLVAVLVKLTTKKHPHLAYALWMVALLKCLTPPLGEFSGSLWSWLPAPSFELESADPALPPSQPPFAADNIEREHVGSSTANGVGVDQVARSSQGEVSMTSAESQIPSAALRTSSPWRIVISVSTCRVLASVWLAGTLLIVGMVWGRARERAVLLRGMTVPPDDSLDRLVMRLERQLGIRRAVTILLTDCPIGPAVSGTKHPVIYLPRILADSLSAAQLETLIAHELIHVRRRDVWAARVQLFVQAVWWFHPAVWWMNRQIDRHRERCCDEEVLASLCGDRATYVSCLVDVLTARQNLKPLPWYPGARPVEITARRLEEIMKRPNMVHRRPPAWSWCMAAIVAALALPGGQQSVADQSTASSPPDSHLSAGPISKRTDQFAEADETGKKEKKGGNASSDRSKRETKGADKSDATLLKYGDGKPDGKKSLGGSGEMIRFELPEGITKVSGIKIHGSRYGYPQAPKEDFEITFVKEDFSEILQTETAPYSTFQRGNSKWVNIKFKQPVELPQSFWIVLNFNAEQTKGVYVSYDTSTKGEHSRIGLAGDDNPKPVEFQGDWMVQVQTAAK